ncbi:MAG TPA: WecB/TagA/CpsF family glycosyltransferase [Tepidisphaeraceae bacterium]|nr:WecB/TagA/CpsF family glycosyltransferase [Tepidisphaeraceae bacterium]
MPLQSEAVELAEPAVGVSLPMADVIVAARGTTTDPQPRSRPSQPIALALPRVWLSGVALHAVTERQAIDHVLCELDAGRGGVVVTPNLDHLYRCTQDLNFAALVAEAQLVVADGMPLVWASRLQGTPLPERVAGSTLVSTLTDAAGLRGRSVFLLGGDPGAADAAARVLSERYPHARIVGTYCPPVGFDRDPRQIAEIEAVLREAQPDLVYVALGSPKQERLIGRIRRVLPRAWWLGVGVSFSFLCGQVQRAPLWMQRCGLEWAHRLWQEPRRLFKRYVVVGIPFASVLLTKSALRGTAKLVVPERYWSSRRRDRQHRSAAQVPPAKTASPQDAAIAAAVAAAAGFSATTPAAPAADAVITVRDETQVTAPAAERHAARRPSVNLESAANEPAAPAPSDATMTRAQSLSRLRGFILLGGGVRATPLKNAIGRSVLDLPLDEHNSILGHWLDNARKVAELAGLEKLPVRVLVDRQSPEPISAPVRHFGSFRVERDRSEYRGTGGVLHDLALDYADDDLILVANAAQVLSDPLPVLVSALDRKRADVALVGHRDGTPSGVMLVTCKTLRLIPDAGYVDMKEQALPAIASRFDVKVVHARRPTGLPIWSLGDYVAALRSHHRRGHAGEGHRPAADPLAEDWRPTFSIVEDGATVDPTAKVHDSVVLRGGVVEPGAVLVRTVVCPGGVVRRDKTVVDEFCRVRGA